MSIQRVAVVGDPSLAAAVETAGGRPVVAGPADVDDDCEFVVAAGEAALVDLAREGVTAPVLPVEAGDGIRSVPRSAAADAVESTLDGGESECSHPVLAAGAGVRALFDVALMAAEPARISEFSVHHDGEQVARFRADGIVASTPAGSVGYSSAAGGPLTAPGTGVLVVVPVAPFATDADRLVLPLDGVALGVERDETPVELLADGRTERDVETGDPVDLSPAGTVETLAVPESESFF